MKYGSINMVYMSSTESSCSGVRCFYCWYFMVEQKSTLTDEMTTEIFRQSDMSCLEDHNSMKRESILTK